MSFWKSFFRKTLLYLMTNRSHIISDYSGPPRWINSISSWDTSFLLYFWGRVLIISAVSGGPWCISQSGDLLPLECCEIEEVWDGSPADRRTSDTFGLGLSLLSGNLINGVCGLTTWTTLLADAILLPIMTPEKGQLNLAFSEGGLHFLAVNIFKVKYLCFLLAALQTMQDLSSSTWDWTHTPCSGSVDS